MIENNTFTIINNEGKNMLHHFEIVNVENIVSYLTADELEKAVKEGLDTNDVAAIITRATGLEPEIETNTRK